MLEIRGQGIPDAAGNGVLRDVRIAKSSPGLLPVVGRGMWQQDIERVVADLVAQGLARCHAHPAGMKERPAALAANQGWRNFMAGIGRRLGIGTT